MEPQQNVNEISKLNDQVQKSQIGVVSFISILSLLETLVSKLPTNWILSQAVLFLFHSLTQINKRTDALCKSLAAVIQGRLESGEPPEKGRLFPKINISSSIRVSWKTVAEDMRKATLGDAYDRAEFEAESKRVYGRESRSEKLEIIDTDTVMGDT